MILLYNFVAEIKNRINKLEIFKYAQLFKWKERSYDACTFIGKCYSSFCIG